jgi:hypothetical protein
MTLTFSRRLAIVFGVLLPIVENIRRWPQLGDVRRWPSSMIEPPATRPRTGISP